MKKLLICFFLSLESLFSCPFCPGGKARDLQTFYEDDLILGIYPYKPLYENHILAVPKRHVERLEELTSEEIEAIFLFAKKVQKNIFSTEKEASYLLLQKNGKSAGQTVPHAHFHLIPIPKDDSNLSVLWRFFTALFSYPLGEEELAKKTAKLEKKMTQELFF